MRCVSIRGTGTFVACLGSRTERKHKPDGSRMREKQAIYDVRVYRTNRQEENCYLTVMLNHDDSISRVIKQLVDRFCVCFFLCVSLRASIYQKFI